MFVRFYFPRVLRKQVILCRLAVLESENQSIEAIVTSSCNWFIHKKPHLSQAFEKLGHGYAEQKSFCDYNHFMINAGAMDKYVCQT